MKIVPGWGKNTASSSSASADMNVYKATKFIEIQYKFQFCHFFPGKQAELDIVSISYFPTGFLPPKSQVVDAFCGGKLDTLWTVSAVHTSSGVPGRKHFFTLLASAPPVLLLWAV